jgi:hypothetical protein
VSSSHESNFWWVGISEIRRLARASIYRRNRITGEEMKTLLNEAQKFIALSLAILLILVVVLSTGSPVADGRPLAAVMI